MYLPEDEIICRPLGPWREEPEEKLVSISDRSAGTIGTYSDLSWLIFLVADWQKPGPGRADVPVHFGNA